MHKKISIEKKDKNIKDNLMFEDSAEDASDSQNMSNKIENILNQVSAPSNERKEKLKIRLMNESQTYY